MTSDQETHWPLVSRTQELEYICRQMAEESYLTVDTEFVRERTYWPQLCLVQLASSKQAVAIDALSPDLDLSPLFDLMQNQKVTKVFHAARQDLEIFLKLMSVLPKPLADTQVLAMINGYGEQVGYEMLVNTIAKAKVDKSHRYTDWSRRPLTSQQLDYALADVTHLRVIYESLLSQAQERNRTDWIEELMLTLNDPETYWVKPVDAWKRLKPRVDKPKFLNVLQKLAEWRELQAQKQNKVRSHVLKDDALNEIAATLPRTKDDLAKVRGLGGQRAQAAFGAQILRLVQEGLGEAELSPLRLPKKTKPSEDHGLAADMLKLLLKMRCEENKVAPRLVATNEEINGFLRGDTQSPLLQGWRHDLFGKEAQALIHGKLSLGFNQGRVTVQDEDPKIDAAPKLP